MRIRRSCPGRPLRGCRVGDVQRAVVHVLVVVVRLSCVVLSVEPVKRAALEIRERPVAEATCSVALSRLGTSCPAAGEDLVHGHAAAPEEVRQDPGAGRPAER